METSNFRPELHVAQKSRRDKLRVQHHSNPSTAQYGDVYTDQLDQFSSHDVGLSPDLVQLRSFRYGNLSYVPTVFSSEMLNFASNSKDVTMVNQDSKRIEGDEEPPVTNLSHTLAANINSSAKVSGAPQNCSTWKSIGSQESCDWIANYTSGSAGGIESNNPNPIFVGGGLSGSLKSNNNNPSTSTLYSNKPSSSYCYHHEVRSSLTSPPSKIPSLNSPKHYGDRVHFKSVPSLYHSANTCQEVSSATVMTQDLGVATIAKQNNRQTAHVSWSNAGNELVLLPAYADHSNPFRLKNGYDECHGWNGELDYSEKNALDRDHRTIANDSANTQALSLSLSSVPLSKSLVCQTGERIMSEDSRSGAGCFSNIQEIKALKSDYLCFDSKQSNDGKVLENVHDDMVVNPTFAHRGACPLGPFTGYATILKSSRFLKPAQQLLGEFCILVGPKCIKMLEPPEKISDEIRASGDAVNINESIAAATVGDSGGSSSTFYSSNEKTLDPGGLNGPSESYRPEYLQKKAKLIYMLEEVCRRYKQYHQQMQMVVSSFECVAGLSAATPYISQALKTVSRHFRCLRNAISDQLKNVRKALGEDLSFNNTGTSSSKGDMSTSRLKLMDQNFQKQKVGGNVGLFEPQQHVWRPQRGLPERAVAILRAWLFDHFLHPYPTDSDKHMLATQTGLSRNQVSNWFINARVRVWKPMVEEIHTLETKGMAETGTNEGKTEGKKTSENVSRSNDSQPLNRLNTGKSTEKQVEYSEIGSSAIMGDRMNDADAWNQKRTQVDCHIPESMDGSLAGCVPYQQSGIGIGGLGAVSLTLGLRQNADGVQPQYPLQQQHEYQLRRHFGDQIIYDFVG